MSVRTIFKNLVLFFSILLSNHLFASQISGRVTDGISGEPLVGASVSLKPIDKTSSVKLDGSYVLKNIPKGKYKLIFQYTGYENVEKEVLINNENDSKVFNVTMLSSSNLLNEVVVSASGKDAESNIRKFEKNAEPVLNILSNKTIQLLPDITVANALQRVSGVTIEKSNTGQGRYPIIRGMEKRYINTLVNGIKIPSPDNKSRFIPLDLFPSELLERLEVSKSLTPSMEGDAIGGTINLVMKDAPDRFLLNANASTGYNSVFMDQNYSKFNTGSISKFSPNDIKNDATYQSVPSDFSKSHLNYTTIKAPKNATFGFTIGDRLGKNKKFGYIVSASYQNIYSGSRSTFFLPNAQPGLGNIPQFIELQDRTYSTQSSRLGLNSKFDYKINKNEKITWVNTYVQLSDQQTRLISDTIALNSLVDKYARSTWQYQSIYNSTLQGVHKIENEGKFDWSLSYSKAKNNMPDQVEFMHEYPVATKSPDILGTLTHKWMHNDDRDFSGNFNLTQNFNQTIEVKVGALYRDKYRTNFFNSYSMKPQLTSGSSTQLFTNIDNAIYIFNPVSAGVPSLNGNTYTFSEKITSLYAQVKWNLTNKLEALGGVRTEITDQMYNTALGKEVDAKSGEIKYTDYLPSLQFKYELNAIQNLRLAYYKGLARPSFAEMIPDGPDGEFFKELGNPQGLNHTTSDNLDFRYEFFPGTADQFLIGTFYKNINDPIEYAAVKTGVTSQSLIPQNFGTATNYGAELVAIKYFGVLGISANYTYTKSSITTPKLYYYRNSTGQITSIIDKETRPLQGQSDHVGNVSFLYKNPKMGLDIQLAGVYTGARISLVSPYKGLDYWLAPTTQLDLSFEKRFKRNWSFYGKLNNLTNTPLQLEIHQPYNTYIATSGSRALSLQTDPANKVIVQKDYYKTSFLFGIRYKF